MSAKKTIQKTVKKHEDDYYHVDKTFAHVIIYLFVLVWLPIWILLQVLMILTDFIIKLVGFALMLIGGLFFTSDAFFMTYKPSIKTFIKEFGILSFMMDEENTKERK